MWVITQYVRDVIGEDEPEEDIHDCDWRCNQLRAEQLKRAGLKDTEKMNGKNGLT